MQRTKQIHIFLVLLLISSVSFSQQNTLSPGRSWWNVLYYTLKITPDCNKKFIAGSNDIKFQVLQPGKLMQIDLQQPMLITSFTWHNASLQFERKGNAYFINFPEDLPKGKTETVTINFEGNPRVSVRPPYDNGWIWSTDKKGRPWMSVTCQGSGASIWFPCKDVLDDEPDNGASISITVPDTLVAVANGRLKKKTTNKNGTTTYDWAVVSTINNYNIIPYIGNYVSWHKDYAGKKGKLDCDYWVLDYNLDKAKKQFRQADSMLQCFEHWMGPYPFYEDGYKLIEAPNSGMEHQSGIAYGNEFSNGFKGRDVSGTGWGLKWDFILIHESGHEWFGNSLTASKHGESWIHEGFTKYLETLYTTYVSGTEAGNDYAVGINKKILNDKPLIGNSTSDHYNKGSAILHMIHQLVGDTVFANILRSLNKKFYHQNISTEQVVIFINQFTKKDFSTIFEQYLRTAQIPDLEYDIKDNVLEYRWTNCVKGFNMPLRVSLRKGTSRLIHPTEQWQKLSVSGNAATSFIVDRNFYVGSKVKK